MRKNSPRKWLHACLDLLPVILIPVFMIYSHRHTIDSGSIQVQEKQVVDFNQLISNDDLYSSFTYYGLTGTKVDGGYHLTGTKEVTSSNYKFFTDTKPLNSSHVYYFRSNNLSLRLNVLLNGTTSYRATPFLNNNIASYRYYLQLPNDDVSDYDVYFYPQLFDLTQMFGSGNEPTMAQFDTMFPDAYYPYTLSHKYLIDGDLVTYNDTDIMSQFTYQFYNAVDKYFNMGNVFNLNGVYDWFNLNIFNGSAPIYIYVVWQIVLYEFVMDLLFLLYGLFMWFIDMVQHLMDKPFKSIK